MGGLGPVAIEQSHADLKGTLQFIACQRPDVF